MTEKRAKLLIVDDDESALRLMQAMLLPRGYSIALAHDGKEALEKVGDISPDLILLDVMIPYLDGFEVVRQLKEAEETHNIPIVIVSALQDVDSRVKALEAGADDFLSKPVDSTELRARVNSLLKVKVYNDHMLTYQKELKTEVAKKTKELQIALKKLQENLEAAVEAMATIAEMRDPDTAGHQKRVTQLACALGEEMGLSQEKLAALRIGGTIHDIGEMYVSAEILTEPGKLADIEFMMIKTHPQVGYDIVKKIEFPPEVAAMVLQHHERLDGSGYPKGLRGNDILLEAKILAVSDVVEAMSSHRPYRPALGIDKALEDISQKRGVLYDSEVVDACLKVITEKGFKFNNGVSPDCMKTGGH